MISSTVLYDLLRKLVQLLRNARVADQEIVAAPAVGALGDVGRVAHHVHVLPYHHGFVVPDKRALDHVVALPVGVQALLLGTLVLLHEGVVFREDLAALRAGLHPVQRELLRFEHEGELVLHLLRGPPEHAGAPQLGVEAARPVVLDEDGELVTFAQHAVLLVAVGEDGGGADRSEPARNNPCSLPCLWPTCSAIAASSSSRMPGFTAAKVSSIALSCIAAVRRMRSSSSGLLIALIRSTMSDASTNFARRSARLR